MRYAPAFAAALLVLVPHVALAADAVTVAQNASAMAQEIAKYAAILCFFGGMVLAGVASLFGMGRLAMGGKGAVVAGVVIGLAAKVYDLFTATGGKLMG